MRARTVREILRPGMQQEHRKKSRKIQPQEIILTRVCRLKVKAEREVGAADPKRNPKALRMKRTKIRTLILNTFRSKR
ncbi:MAG: hypothetical protein LUK37_21550 [Clostridia bacterium]|nr:hypothetical protein [Clostridia bacterium]